MQKRRHGRATRTARGRVKAQSPSTNTSMLRFRRGNVGRCGGHAARSCERCYPGLGHAPMVWDYLDGIWFIFYDRQSIHQQHCELHAGAGGVAGAGGMCRTCRSRFAVFPLGATQATDPTLSPASGGQRAVLFCRMYCSHLICARCGWARGGGRSEVHGAKGRGGGGW